MFLPSNITLKFGDSGDFVAELQRRLAGIGVHSDQAISGAYDGTTVNSVSSFQARMGLRAEDVKVCSPWKVLSFSTTAAGTRVEWNFERIANWGP